MLQPTTTDAALIAFIHINKCGGTSVAAALRSCDLPASRFAEASGSGGLHHHTLRWYAQMNPTRDVSSLLTFAIVRDPYARMVSLYCSPAMFCMGMHAGHDRYERAPTRGRPSAGPWGNRWQTRRLNSLKIASSI